MIYFRLKKIKVMTKKKATANAVAFDKSFLCIRLLSVVVETNASLST